MIDLLAWDAAHVFVSSPLAPGDITAFALGLEANRRGNGW